jgi:hypothetical protein
MTNQSFNRPDPRRIESWCRGGIAHDHSACGSLWDSSSGRDIREAADYADELGQREQSAATLPVGSVVATAEDAFVKADRSGTMISHCPWVSTSAEQRVYTNGAVDKLLAAGEAKVLRVGSES